MNRTLLVSFIAAMLLSSYANQAAAISLAIDMDATPVLSGPPGIETQAGFTSWDVSGFRGPFGNIFNDFSTQGIDFRLFGSNSDIGSGKSSTGGGGATDDLLIDYARGDWGRIPGQGYLGLRISGLPVGQYAMSSWHYDADIFDYETNFIQIEINNTTDSGVGGPVVVDHFPLQQAAANYTFEVTLPGQTKQIFFRGDGNIGQSLISHRVRLNGFTITSIPEPSALVIVASSALGMALMRRR